MATNSQTYQINCDPKDFVKGINTALSALRTLKKQLGDTDSKTKDSSSGFSNYEKTLSSVSKISKKLASTTKGFSKALSSVKSPIENFAKSLSKIWKMLRLMVLRTALRKVIEEVGNGFKGLAKYSSEFDSSMSLLSNSSKQLGYSFSAMVAPLINALAPALNEIIQLCIKAVNAINQLFSAFSGKSTFISAKKQTEDWADSLDSAGKSAEKAKKTIMGFDEINKLDDNSSSGSSSSLDPNSMFETKDIPTSIKDLKDKILDAWKNADFTELGSILGNKLKKALESIPWDSIKSTAGKIGKSLATFINGFVEVDGLGYDIGSTIAEAFNTAFEFAYNFVTNLHWDSIGKFIGDSINGFFDTFDFAKAGQTISEAVKGLLTTVENTLLTVDWANIGAKIADFLYNIDWNGIFSKLGSTVGSAMGSALKLAWGFLKQSFNNKVQEANGNVLLAIGNIILDATSMLTFTYWTNNFTAPAIKALWDSLKPELEGLWDNHIVPLWETAKETVKGWFKSLKSVVEDGLKPIKDLWNGFVDKINGTHSFLGFNYSINLPHAYATGGFPEDGLFYANHNEMVGKFSNGKTAVANNEQITSGIAQAVYQAMMSANGGSSSYINNTIQIDGETIARAVTKGQNSLNRRYSPTMA